MVNLRTKPIDRRRLSMKDRESYRPNDRMKKISRARQRAGAMAQQRNRQPFTTERKPGTGGFTQGVAAQQLRNRTEGAKVRRAESLRPEIDYPTQK